MVKAHVELREVEGHEIHQRRAFHRVERIDAAEVAFEDGRRDRVAFHHAHVHALLCARRVPAPGQHAAGRVHRDAEPFAGDGGVGEAFRDPGRARPRRRSSRAPRRGWQWRRLRARHR
jgi:hypothetical protein